VGVGAEKKCPRLAVVRGRTPHRAGGRPEIKRALAPVVFHFHRRFQRLRLGTDIVFPDDAARRRFERDDETAAGAAARLGIERDCMLVAAAATMILPSAKIGDAKTQFELWYPGKGLARVSIFQRSLPVPRSSAKMVPPASPM